MFHTNTVYKTRSHSSGVRIETDTRERLETKQTSIVQSTHMTLHHFFFFFWLRGRYIINTAKQITK